MDENRWPLVEAIFEQALERSPAELHQFLEAACEGDQDLLRDVEHLLRHHGAAEEKGFLESPPGISGSLRSNSPQEDPYIGSNLGPYRILRWQGGGGMGDVYLAMRQADFHHQVAVKVLKRNLNAVDVVRRFRNEIQILAALGRHENIAALLDAGTTEDGLPYLVMEYVDGEPLGSYCDHHRHTIQERIELFQRVCAAVHFAHRHMVIHRDLKMGNILVRADGVPKLIDFGIAKLTVPELGDPSFFPGPTAHRMMTLEYASPEQVRRDPLTAATDVYSLGVVLYELLAGCKPHVFGDTAGQDYVKVICDQEPPSPSAALKQDPGEVSKLRSTTPRKLKNLLAGDLGKIVLKALRKEPQRRYGTVEGLSDDLARFLKGFPVEARPPRPTRRAFLWCRRNPVPAALLATVFLTLGVGLWHLDRLSDQLVRAAAIEGATLEAQTLSIVQDFYAKVVVANIEGRVPVTHRYAMVDGAIPVPASFTIDLGKQIRASHVAGMVARLYSDFPFAQREGGGPQDEFEVLALEQLRANPEQPFYRFETYEGRPSLRYASARVMQGACVACHNSHPDSTKTDWEVGELRGVLEIIRPLDLDIARVQNRLRETFAFMLGVSVLLIVLALFFTRTGRKG